MTAPKRRQPGGLFGRTLETVLAERPARVIIESLPDGHGPSRLPERQPRQPTVA
jgi:hypothetical protein